MFSAKGKLPSAEEIQERIDKRYDELYFKPEKGKRIPYVCVVCDSFIVGKDQLEDLNVLSLEKAKHLFQWSSQEDSRRTSQLQRHFRVGKDIQKVYPFLDDCALSPRAPFYTKRSKDYFSCCKRCAGNVKNKPTSPRHATINSNCVGGAPKCLMELTEPELAFLSPVKHYGYCFTFTGGKQKCLKGTLSFMKVSRKSIVKAVSTLENFGLNDNVLILYSGKLTKWQQDRAKELCSVRTAKLIKAVEWLCANNKSWKGYNKESIKRELARRAPVVVDKSEVVEGVNSNIEEKEVFTCYYPDGAATPTTGGMENADCFKKFVSEMAEKGYDVEFQANLRKDYVTEVDGDLLVSSNLLQFPYGIGGMNDRRQLHDGSYTTKSNMDEYLSYLSC